MKIELKIMLIAVLAIYLILELVFRNYAGFLRSALSFTAGYGIAVFVNKKRSK